MPGIQSQQCLPCRLCLAPTAGAEWSPCPPISSVPVVLICPRSRQRGAGSCTGLPLNRSWCTDTGVLGPDITLEVAWNRGERRALSRLNTPALKHSQISTTANKEGAAYFGMQQAGQHGRLPGCASSCSCQPRKDDLTMHTGSTDLSSAHLGCYGAVAGAPAATAEGTACQPVQQSAAASSQDSASGPEPQAETSLRAQTAGHGALQASAGRLKGPLCEL